MANSIINQVVNENNRKIHIYTQFYRGERRERRAIINNKSKGPTVGATSTG